MLALHEIGVSYRFGWGIEKNKKMAVSYFTLSADLGDQDAQLDVAFAYANGKGCKKDLKKAAHYYRLAIAQGAEDWGLSWIYKVKKKSSLLPFSLYVLNQFRLCLEQPKYMDT